jgi:hypothetical protein
MAADLYEAIADLVHADAALQLLFGDTVFFWVGKALRDSLPRCELIDVSGSIEPEADNGGDPSWIARVVFQITAFASARASARALGRAVAQAIERADAAGGLVHAETTIPLSVRRTGEGIDQLDPDPAPDGGPVWAHTIQFAAFSGNSDT